MTEDEKIAHLSLVQGVINRMGGNSFLIKGWTVALVAAIFALAASGTNQKFIFIALVPIISFWFLDSYYLKQEKLYRELYDDIVANSSRVAAFSMSAKGYKVKCIPRLMLTISTGPFYSILVGILVFVVLGVDEISSLGFVKNLCIK